MIQAKLDKMEGDRVILETKLKDCQQSLLAGKNQKCNPSTEDNNNQKNNKRRRCKGLREV